MRTLGATIGENVDILMSGVEGGALDPLLEIGNNVTIIDTRELLYDAGTYMFIEYNKVVKATIGDDVIIGNGVTILHNTHTGSRVVIGAGAVVVEDMLKNTVVSENLARIIKENILPK